MRKLKLAERLVLTIAALATALKGIIKFIEHIVRLRTKPATAKI